ncbi:MAG: penicillin-binding protein 2 [Gaiellales bacterium]
MTTVFTLLCVGFAGIIGMLTWWQVIVAGELRQKDENNQTAYYEQRVQRGFISTRDGVRLAGRTATTGSNGDKIWTRRYAKGNLAAHVLGYDTRGHSRAGIERAMNDSLTGSTRDLGAVVGLLDGDEAAIGDDVVLTINAGAQEVAERALQGKVGAIVAIEPSTGRVLTMASAPTFDPMDVMRDFDAVAANEGALFNRATQASYPPGSTFKVVTAAAALEDGLSPDHTFKGGSEFKTTGGAIRNFAGASYGPHDLTTALTKSINVSFAELGVQLGDTKLRDQMERFGFFSKPPLYGLPGAEVRASGMTGTDGKPLPATMGFDEARTAIGQDKLTVTPLQMALVTAAIANKGIVPEPTLIEKVQRAGGGATVERLRTKPWRTAISPETARELGAMMENVVREGSGTQAALQGIDVAGKTGTADTPSGNLVWFIAYAPANRPKVAIAVAVERQSSGMTGGDVAAPIARSVIEALLGRGGVQ